MHHSGPFLTEVQQLPKLIEETGQPGQTLSLHFMHCFKQFSLADDLEDSLTIILEEICTKQAYSTE